VNYVKYYWRSFTYGYLQPCSVLVLVFAALFGSTSGTCSLFCSTTGICSPVLFYLRVLAALFCSTYWYLQPWSCLLTGTCSLVLFYVLVIALLLFYLLVLTALFCSTYGYLQPSSVLLTGICSPVPFYLRVLASLFCSTYWYLQPCSVFLTGTCSPVLFYLLVFAGLFFSTLQRRERFFVHLVQDTVHYLLSCCSSSLHICAVSRARSGKNKSKAAYKLPAANKSSLPRPMTSGVYCTVVCQDWIELKKNGIMFADKPRTGDPATVSTTQVNRENCLLYHRTSQHWFQQSLILQWCIYNRGRTFNEWNGRKTAQRTKNKSLMMEAAKSYVGGRRIIHPLRVKCLIKMFDSVSRVRPHARVYFEVLLGL
jgi:hypothetical protein